MWRRVDPFVARLIDSMPSFMGSRGEGTDVTGKAPEGLKWEIRKRLEFIEFLLYWEGQIRYSDIQDYFRVSDTQAGKDIKIYEEYSRHPDGVGGTISNLVHPQKRGASYTAAQDFRCVMIEPDFDDYMTFYDGRWRATWKSRETGSGGKASGLVGARRRPQNLRIVRVNTIERRPVDPQIYRKLLEAIAKRKAVGVAYLSPNFDAPRRFEISPSYLGFDGFRWHVRAFRQDVGAWCDVVMERIQAADKDLTDLAKPVPADVGSRMTTLRICPNPELTESQRANIEAQYPEMKDGVWEGTMVRSFIPYFLKRYQIEEKSLRKLPHQDPIFLMYRDRVTEEIEPGMRVPPGSTRDRLEASLRKTRAALGSEEASSVSDLELVLTALEAYPKAKV